MVINYEIYHGTTNVSASSILKDKKFKFTHRDDHWLGNGVYFFINDYSTAQWWANNAVKKASRNSSSIQQSISPTVLKGMIAVETEQLLDLDSLDDMEKFIDFVKLISEKYQMTNVSNKHEAMCKLMDTYVEMYNLDAVVYTFDRNNTADMLYSLGLRQHGRQLCVFNQRVINFTSLKEV
ncbi:hypothetical protein [Lactiplantibacillus plantarum]|uniref:hypothetical protein n=1 Tax=Lactiplantibacillus plantarum TaxID=1590 RepID=UPI0011C77FBA|nr:hypothetical protein [Lactiplantibacillus plantarum]MDO8182068.1 hypothetical protein [Lactiplantibacillus plantarum]TXJ95569.1 hypothetical protein FU657_06940 [Lactiplantibacillus plantarum]